MSYPKITICIPCYNSEKYIPEVFKCIESQTFSDFDVLFIDDGSTDNTLEKIKEFKEKTSLKNKITIIHQENKGISSTRNRLVSSAKGDYILFMDPDDILSKRALEHLYKYSDDGKRDIVVGRATLIFFNFFRFPFFVLYRYKKNISSKHYVKSNICVAWASILKKNLFDEHKFLEGYTYEDVGLMNYLYLKNTNFKSIKKIVYSYRRHKGSLSSFILKKKWSVIDIYNQSNYAFSKYKKEGWLESKEYRRYINGTLFQILVACHWLEKFYSNNKIINKMPSLALVNLINSYGVTLRFSKTFWKSLSYFYIINLFKKNKKIILSASSDFLNKFSFVNNLSLLKNKSNTICFIDKYSDKLDLIKKYKKVTFFSLEESKGLQNVLYGIKPSKITKQILTYEKIYFIDLRNIKTFSKTDLELISKINPRILILINKNQSKFFQNKFNIIRTN